MNFVTYCREDPEYLSFHPELDLLGDLIANTHYNLALVDCGVYFLDTVDLQGYTELGAEGLVTEKLEI